jgi:protein-tyrosine-phosphatase
MSHPDPGHGARPVIIAIDHGFIADESDGAAQRAYDALGALDAEAPEAICPISSDDLRVLVEASLTRSAIVDPTSAEFRAITGAARRVRHVIERSAQWVSVSVLVVMSTYAA